MTLTLELTPEEERRVQGANAKGIDIAAIIKGGISGLPEAPEAGMLEDKTLTMLQAWRAADATDDEEELARRDAELAAFKANMNANRALSGEEPIY